MHLSRLPGEVFAALRGSTPYPIHVFRFSAYLRNRNQGVTNPLFRIIPAQSLPKT